MRIHEVANIMPAMTAEEYEFLKADIAKNGQLEPIWTYDNQIIDGRHRHKACAELGIKQKYKEYTGDQPLIDFVLSLNLHRRHLTIGQKAVIALQILPMYEAEAKKRQEAQAEKGKLGGRGNKKTLGDNCPQGFREDRATEKAAKAVGISRKSVERAEKIQSERPDLFKQIKTGKVSINKAVAEIKKQEKEKAVSAVRQKIFTEDCIVINGDATCMPLEKFERYRVIIADPPWEYDFFVANNRSIQSKYSVMTTKDICDMPVKSLAADDCILFLWGTWPKLKDALAVAESWGFDQFLTGFPWIKLSKDNKPFYGMGHWVRGCSEYVLIFRTGVLSPPPGISDYLGLMSPNLEHSKKPQSLHDMAELIEGPRLELFGRRKVPGWTVFGNELE